MPAPALSADAKPPASGWLKILLLAVLFCCIHGRACLAATWGITEARHLNFDTLQIPGSSVYETISASGGEMGTGTYLYGPAVFSGQFTVTCTGSGCGTFSVDVYAFGSSSVCGTLSSPVGKYNNIPLSGPPPWNNLANPGSGGINLALGLTDTYSSTVLTGLCSLGFTISAATAAVNFSASVAYDTGLSLTKNSDINFGTVTALNASTYKITTAGAVTTTAGTGVQLYGTTSAGNITIVGSAADGITISTGGYIANNGVTPSAATCAYNGGGASSCNAGISVAAPGAGSTLLIGVDVTTDGTQVAGTTAAPSFTVTVTYH